MKKQLLVCLLVLLLIPISSSSAHSMPCSPNCAYVKFHVTLNGIEIKGANAVIGLLDQNQSDSSNGSTNSYGNIKLPAYPNMHYYAEVTFVQAYNGTNHRCEYFGGANSGNVNTTTKYIVSFAGC